VKSRRRFLAAGLSVAALLALGALAAYLAGRIGARSRPPAAAPGTNVVLISIDTLRADRLSVYGYPRPTSPTLEALARQGVVFDNYFYVGGGTLPSHMSMMTSLYPATHGIDPAHQTRLDDARVTLAEALRGAGYATAAFVDGGWLSAKFGFDQGFDLYDDAGVHFAETLPRAETWIRQHARSPFFLFLHTYDVHSQWVQRPYDCPGDEELSFAGSPPPSFDGCRDGACASELLLKVDTRIRAGELRGDAYFSPPEVRYISDLYDGCVRYTDRRIGEILGWLVELGIDDRTLVAVTSDHGEELLDHGMFLHEQGGYEEYAHIPLLLRLPRRALAGKRVAGMAAIVDLMPTLLALAGLPAPAEAQGRSLLPAMFEDRTVRNDVHMYSVLRTERWKYFSDERRLFNLALDPRETGNLWSARTGKVAALERRVRDLIAQDFLHRQGLGPGSAAPAVLSPEEIERLRALGYLR
jgi:arylsulfatase A-like enzyme